MELSDSTERAAKKEKVLQKAYGARDKIGVITGNLKGRNFIVKQVLNQNSNRNS